MRRGSDIGLPERHQKYLCLFRQQFFDDHVNLTLVIVTPGIISLSCLIDNQRFISVVFFCEHNKFIIIKLLIAKADNFRMAAVMLLQ